MLTDWNLTLLDNRPVLFILSLIAITGFPVWNPNFFTNAVQFRPDTAFFKTWQETKVPLTMDVYFYNWTNPEDIYNSSIKPNFVETGPYRYKQFQEKTNITWNSNETVTYQYLNNFYFDSENSPGDDLDVITTLDMVALMTAHATKDMNYFLKHSINIMLSQSQIYVRKTVRELLFEGYEDFILRATTAMRGLFENQVNRFGWFYGRNGSAGTDGVYNIETSADENFGSLKRWNYESRTPFYKGSCADIKGSDGELYPRHISPTNIQFFSRQMCRTVQFNFDSNVTVKGVPSYKFSPGDELFDNGTKIKENMCYCNGKCLPSGVLNISACTHGAPLYISSPHFYQADSIYVEAVEGLHPVKERHEMYLSLEPNSGTVVDRSNRIQINALLQPVSSIRLFEDAPNIMFPIFWYEQKAVVSDDMALLLT